MSEPEIPLENMALDFTAKDPVCGMTVDPPQARGKAKYHGDTYFFCSPGCMHKFTAEPARDVGDSGTPGNGAAAQPAPRKLEKDPVCGIMVDPQKAASPAEYDRQLYHFCSRGCAEKFQRDPKRYRLYPSAQTPRGGNSAGSSKAGTPGMVQMGTATLQIGATPKLEKDPVCGMNVDTAKPAAVLTHDGKTYYFCCEGCAEKFKADPAK